MSKKLLVAGVMLALVATVFVGAGPITVSADAATCALVTTLSNAGLIPADKLAVAQTAAGCGVAAPAAASFMRNLTIGSTGADVTALQTKLGVTPATGYFGAITKAAVIAYQTANGITPAAGYVGPITLAKLNYVAPVVAPVVTPGTTPAAGLEGGAGDIDVSTSTTDVEDTILEGETENALSFKVEASDSDVAVKNLKITLENDNAVSSYRLSNYADEVMIYMGKLKVGSVDVADFNKDGHIYSKSVTLTDAIVREGSSKKATFYVKIAAASNVDGDDLDINDWNVKVSGIRFTDATGSVMSDDSVVENNVVFSDLASSGDVTLTVSKVSAATEVKNVEVSETSATSEILMLEFKIKAKGSDLSFDTLEVDLDGTLAGTETLQDLLGELTLTDSSGDELASVSSFAAAADETNVAFELNDTYTIDAGKTDTFKVYAKVNKTDGNYTSGAILKVSVPTTDAVAAEDVNGDVIDQDGSAAGDAQTFILNGSSVKYVSSTYTAPNTTDDIDGTITMKFTVEAFGDEEVVLTEDQFGTAKTTGVASQSAGAEVVVFTVTGGKTSDAILTSTSVAKDATDKFTVSSGSTETFTLSVKIDQSVALTGFVRLAINNVANTAVTNVQTPAY